MHPAISVFAALATGLLGCRAALAIAPETSTLAQSAASTTTHTGVKSEGPMQPAKVQDGQHTDKNGDPTCHVTDGGKRVDRCTPFGYGRQSMKSMA